MKYFPSIIRADQEANAESVNRCFRRVEEVLASPAGDNFVEEAFTWENVPREETTRVAVMYDDDTEDALVTDADHLICTPYNTTTDAYEGNGGVRLPFALAWAKATVRGLVLEKKAEMRAGFLHVIFSAQVSSSGIWPAAIQFALRVDGNVVQESAWGGLASTQDPMAGYSQTEFPVMIQVLMPIFDGDHVVEVMYRNVLSWQDADEKKKTFRIIGYDLIVMEMGGA